MFVNVPNEWHDTVGSNPHLLSQLGEEGLLDQQLVSIIQGCFIVRTGVSAIVNISQQRDVIRVGLI
jgi:hypothetical protein